MKKPIIIAEIGNNHEGSFFNAKKLINEAKKDIYPKSCVKDLLLKIKEYFEIFWR